MWTGDNVIDIATIAVTEVPYIAMLISADALDYCQATDPLPDKVFCFGYILSIRYVLGGKKI